MHGHSVSELSNPPPPPSPPTWTARCLAFHLKPAQHVAFRITKATKPSHHFKSIMLGEEETNYRII